MDERPGRNSTIRPRISQRGHGMAAGRRPKALPCMASLVALPCGAPRLMGSRDRAKREPVMRIIALSAAALVAGLATAAQAAPAVVDVAIGPQLQAKAEKTYGERDV